MSHDRKSGAVTAQTGEPDGKTQESVFAMLMFIPFLVSRWPKLGPLFKDFEKALDKELDRDRSKPPGAKLRRAKKKLDEALASPEIARATLDYMAKVRMEREGLRPVEAQEASRIGSPNIVPLRTEPTVEPHSPSMLQFRTRTDSSVGVREQIKRLTRLFNELDANAQEQLLAYGQRLRRGAPPSKKTGRRERKGLAKAAPNDRYDGRPDSSEDVSYFIKRMYGNLLDGNFTRADLRHVDDSAAKALDNWERRHGRLPLSRLNLPTLKQRNDQLLKAGSGEDRLEELRLQSLARVRRHRGRALK